MSYKLIDIVDSLPRNPKKDVKTRHLEEIKSIVVHTTDDDCTPQALAKYDIGPNHISPTGCPTITYHEMVMDDGTVYLTLGYDEIGWHTGFINGAAIGIAMVYKCTNSKGKDEFPPFEKQLVSCEERCGNLCLEFCITPQNIFGHREIEGTGWNWVDGKKVLRKTCPGLKVDLDLFRQDVTKWLQMVLQDEGLYDGEIDGDFGPLSKQALQNYPR